MQRATLGFQVRFDDSTIRELTYGEVGETVALDNFVKEHKELLPLTTPTLKEQAQLKKRIKSEPIPEAYKNATHILIDLRCRIIFSYEWYSQHIEPRSDANTHKYLVRAKIGKSTGKSVIATLEVDKGFLDRPKQVPIDNWDIHTYVYLESEVNPDKCTVLRNHTQGESLNLMTEPHNVGKVKGTMEGEPRQDHLLWACQFPKSLSPDLPICSSFILLITIIKLFESFQ